MRQSRTPQRPLFQTSRWLGPTWTWQASFAITSAGYANLVAVEASRNHEGALLRGLASCDISHSDDPMQVLGALAVESMLVAVSPTLTGETVARHFRSPEELGL